MDGSRVHSFSCSVSVKFRLLQWITFADRSWIALTMTPRRHAWMILTLKTRQPHLQCVSLLLSVTVKFDGFNNR